jgi:hypothetical protein
LINIKEGCYNFNERARVASPDLFLIAADFMGGVVWGVSDVEILGTSQLRRTMAQGQDRSAWKIFANR